MTRFRNGMPAAVQSLILGTHIPLAAKTMKISLVVDNERIGDQWIHSEGGFAGWFGDPSHFRWDILARALELIEAMNGYRDDGTVTGILFEDADTHKDKTVGHQEDSETLEDE